MTPLEYRDAVAAEIAQRTGWTIEQAISVTGAPEDMADAMADEMTAPEYAYEILLEASQP